MTEPQFDKSQNNSIIKITELTKSQRGFLEYCKNFGWGKVEVTVKNGEPVMVSVVRQETKLD